MIKCWSPIHLFAESTAGASPVQASKKVCFSRLPLAGLHPATPQLTHYSFSGTDRSDGQMQHCGFAAVVGQPLSWVALVWKHLRTYRYWSFLHLKDRLPEQVKSRTFLWNWRLLSVDNGCVPIRNGGALSTEQIQCLCGENTFLDQCATNTMFSTSIMLSATSAPWLWWGVGLQFTHGPAGT